MCLCVSAHTQGYIYVHIHEQQIHKQIDTRASLGGTGGSSALSGQVSPIISPGNERGVDLGGLAWPHGGVGAHGVVEAPLHWAGVAGNHSLVSTYGQQGYMQVSPPRQSPCCPVSSLYVGVDTLAARVTGKQEDNSRRSQNWMHHAETIALVHDQVSVHARTHNTHNTHTHTHTLSLSLSLSHTHTHSHTHTKLTHACSYVCMQARLRE